MCAVFLAVANGFREQTFEMASVHREDGILPITSATLDPSFRDSVLPGTPERSPHTPDSHRPNRGWNFRPLVRIAVEEEKPRSRLERKRFPELLDNSPSGGTLSEVEVQNASTVLAHEEEAIQQTERDG
jgi:hypothetical protein